MPTIAVGLYKTLAYKIESVFGQLAGASGGQLLRRTKSTIDLSKETYQSNEIRTDFQIADFRHGVRSVQGTISGELSGGTYKDLFNVALKRDFASITAATSVSVTIGSPTGGVYPLTRAAGSFYTDGFKIGQVIRLSVGSLNAANINKNLLIVDITSATAASVITLNGSALVAEGPITGCTVSVIGKTTYIPQTGHTDKSITFEHFYSDLGQSEQFVGCKIDKIGLSLPPTGMATVDFEVTGKDMSVSATQYFTAPSAVTTSGTLAAVNGVLRMAGQTVASVTGLTLEIDPKYDGEPVVGSNTKPALFAGTVTVTGQATIFFDSVVFRDAFLNETEAELIVALTADNTATSEFVSISLPRTKFGGASKDDGQGGLKQTVPIQALVQVNGGAGTKYEKTSVYIQDSLA